MKILIADDEKDVRSLVKFSFERSGFEVLEAADGIQALALVKAKLPDVVLLDIMMPGMDGYHVCRNLKEDPLTKDIPLIILSAKGQSYEIDQGLKCGAFAYVVKPFAPKALVAQVKEMLGL